MYWVRVQALKNKTAALLSKEAHILVVETYNYNMQHHEMWSNGRVPNWVGLWKAS